MEEEQYKYEPFDRRHSQEYAVVILLPADLDALVAPHRERKILSIQMCIIFHKVKLQPPQGKQLDSADWTVYAIL